MPRIAQALQHRAAQDFIVFDQQDAHGWRMKADPLYRSGEAAAAETSALRFHQPPPSDWNKATVSPSRAARACARVSRAW